MSWHNFALDLRTVDTFSWLYCDLVWNMAEVWNANKGQDKALESIQLHACKYILGCSVTTCDEPVHANLGLETLKYRRGFHILKWYCEVEHMMKDFHLSCYQMSGIK